MREDLQILCDHAEHGRGLARAIVSRQWLEHRIKQAGLDPKDWDLNPQLQVKAVADQVVTDVQAEGFSECTREEIYLLWLTTRIFDHARLESS